MGGWSEEAELGHGKFGVVHSCVPDESAPGTTPQHALKRLKGEHAQDEELRKRFARETEILAGLDHANLMPVVDSGETADGVPFLVMPLAEGGSLKDAIVDGRADDRNWWIEMFEGVLAGVAHAHHHGILHRDLKPRNILLFPDGPRVSDFGIAKQLDLDGTTLTKSAQELGTLRYMAPEQLHDPRTAAKPADVYSLGKVFAHLITGITPEMLKVDILKVPGKFQFFVDKCCREDPERRYPDAGQAHAGFQTSLVGQETTLPADERIQELAERAAAALGTSAQRDAIDALDAHVRANGEHAEMNRSGIPYLPNGVIRAWSDQLPEGFRIAMESYDTHISGGLDFSYCDVVADFYAAVFRLTKDPALKRLIIERLLNVGSSHNRWHVSDVLVELFASMSEPLDVSIAAEAIENDQKSADWYAASALENELVAPIASALREAQAARRR